MRIRSDTPSLMPLSILFILLLRLDISWRCSLESTVLPKALTRLREAVLQPRLLRRSLRQSLEQRSREAPLDSEA